MRRRSARGFTLLEMIVVIVIVALAATLLIARGPARSPRLEVEALAQHLAGTLRLARAQAISANHPVSFVYDAGRHAFALDGGTIQNLPPQIDVAMVAADAGRIGNRIGLIAFAPDGSSSGGRITLGEAGRSAAIGVDWLTGRVSVVY